MAIYYHNIPDKSKMVTVRHDRADQFLALGYKVVQKTPDASVLIKEDDAVEKDVVQEEEIKEEEEASDGEKSRKSS